MVTLHQSQHVVIIDRHVEGHGACGVTGLAPRSCTCNNWSSIFVLILKGNSKSSEVVGSNPRDGQVDLNTIACIDVSEDVVWLICGAGVEGMGVGS